MNPTKLMIGLVIEKHLFLFRPNTNRPTGAGDWVRTSNFVLGRNALCQLSYTRVLFLIWSGRPGSNWPPQPWQGCALPNELLPQLWTSLDLNQGPPDYESGAANQLSYMSKSFIPTINSVPEERLVTHTMSISDTPPT
jgi:hypothetical protein